MIYLAVAAFLLITFASRSSFLYPYNDWDDANSYFSMGKALFNGKVLYKDIYDQKGGYLYLFYGLAYLISHTTFRGVYILEILLAIADLFLILQILKLYTKDSTALVLTPLPLAAVFSSRSFYWGGSAEEIFFPLLLLGLYLFLQYFKYYPERQMKRSSLFVTGLMAGIVANIKYTSLGFFFAWMMWIALAILIEKGLAESLKACGIFLAGMVIPFFPWIIYFATHDALYYWYWAYVLNNVSVYSNLNGEGPGLWERVYSLIKLLYWAILSNRNYFIFLIPGIFFTFLGKGKKLIQRFSVPVLFFFLFLGIYIGGVGLFYYALPLGIFTVLGFAMVGCCWDKFLSYRKEQKIITGHAVCCVLSILVGTALIYYTSMNTDFMKVKKEDHFLYQFQTIVSQEENPSLLNIGCLDAGLYTVCDIIPNCQWFQTNGINLDIMHREQERYIREGLITFIIARDFYPAVIWEKYELVAEVPYSWKDQSFTYYLFRKNEVNDTM